MKAKYKRILLKISGEALSGAAGHGFDPESLKSVAEQILEVAKLGVEVGIVVGGGNIWRGRQGMNMDRVTADQMGMLATVINALAVSEALIGVGADARVLTSIEISGVGEKFNHKVADRYLKEGKIVVFGGGTGNPFFSTDTGAALKAAEIGADALLLAKNIDGIYDSDPKTNPNSLTTNTLREDSGLWTLRLSLCARKTGLKFTRSGFRTKIR